MHACMCARACLLVATIRSCTRNNFWEKQFLGAAGPGCRACELHALQGAGLWTQVVSFMLKGLSERYVRSEGSGSAFGFTV